MSPNVNDLNPYVTSLDVRDGDLITFKSAGKIVKVDFSRARDGSDVKQVLDIDVQLPNGKIKKINPNKTSQKSLAVSYGVNTENWINKQAVVIIAKQNVSGQWKNVIYLEPPTSTNIQSPVEEIPDQEEMPDDDIPY